MSRKIQLFCLPYAGGTADGFRELEGLLGEEIQAVSLDYAGHGTRKSEPLYSDFDEMAKDISEKIAKQRERQLPFALFGYSMGSLVAYEAACHYCSPDDLPVHIFLAAHEAPDVPEKYAEFQAYTKLNEEVFMERMTKLGGYEKYEPRLLKNRFFRELFLNPLRRDYELLANYTVRERCYLPCEATVFYSPADTSEDKIHSWDSYAREGIEYVPLGEHHFFIKQHAREMAEKIRTKLK